MSQKIKIAIIGAPNAGKSTFFNKLIGGRRSIVEDIAGVTRDRIYAEVNLSKFHPENKDFPLTIIDTGGLFFEDDTLYEGVQKQVKLAIKEADLIIFMTDGRAGLRIVDEKITKFVQNINKPVILLVNKLDSFEIYGQASDFYKLGLGEPLAFSCKGGTFKNSLINLIKKIEELKPKKIHTNEDSEANINLHLVPNSIDEGDYPKIAMFGRPNVGKSSLLNKLVGYERSLVHDKAGTTRDALDTFLNYKEKEIMLIDTAGLRRKSKVYEDLERFSVDRAIKGLVRCDIAILVIDAIEGITSQEQKLASLIQSRGKGCIIALNKWDLVEDKDYHKQEELIRYKLPYIDYAPIVICSAETGQRTEQLLEQALIIYENMQRRITTRLLNNILRERLTIKRINKQLKIYFISQTGINPPQFTMSVNNPKYLDKNYQKYIDRSLREEFEFTGVPFRWEIKEH